MNMMRESAERMEEVLVRSKRMSKTEKEKLAMGKEEMLRYGEDMARVYKARTKYLEDQMTELDRLIDEDEDRENDLRKELKEWKKKEIKWREERTKWEEERKEWDMEKERIGRERIGWQKDKEKLEDRIFVLECGKGLEVDRGTTGIRSPWAGGSAEREEKTPDRSGGKG
ncbi:calcium-binding and coiled-coil domain-containing protein 2-like [Odontomachus brunneus]|uniref:calcium-binding and coiled-coil domain-containing protein 2-like n=1 Tax=Odontomachus brunneus TaxID=486640 RepID=UPI0013F1FDA3|nr:calcium-binding and coiled-coil domain-containing protein 2-like [Odontomachus brunneus]